MKKSIIFLCIIAILFISSTSFADTAIKKLGRGAANILTCPFEIVYGTGQAFEESGIIGAVSWGILNGFYRMARRGIVGFYEVLTFPIPLPAYYGPVIDDPEFFFEGFLN